MSDKLTSGISNPMYGVNTDAMIIRGTESGPKSGTEQPVPTTVHNIPDTAESGTGEGVYDKIHDAETLDVAETTVKRPDLPARPLPDPNTTRPLPDPNTARTPPDPPARPLPDPNTARPPPNPTARPLPDPNTARTPPDPLARPLPDPNTTRTPPDPLARPLPDPNTPARPLPDPNTTQPLPEQKSEPKPSEERRKQIEERRGVKLNGYVPESSTTDPDVFDNPTYGITPDANQEPIYDYVRGEHPDHGDYVTRDSVDLVIAPLPKSEKVFPRRKILILAAVVVLAAIVAVAVTTALILKPAEETKVRHDAVKDSNHRELYVSLKVTDGRYSNYVTAYEDENSREFKEFSAEFEKYMKLLFDVTTASYIYSHSNVTHLLPGSVNVIFKIVFNGDPETIAEYDDKRVKTLLKASIENAGRKGAFIIDPDSIQVSNTNNFQPPHFDVECLKGNVDFNKYCKKLVGYDVVRDQGYPRTDLDDLMKKLNNASRLTDECRDNVMTFYCSSIFHQCVNNKAVKPCQSSCLQVAKACPQLNKIRSFECEKLADEDCRLTRRVFQCKQSEFMCINGAVVSGLSRCISNDRVCDGRADCIDGQDEHPDRCRNGTCITTNTFKQYCQPIVNYNYTVFHPELTGIRNPQLVKLLVNAVNNIDRLGQAHLISEDCRRHLFPFYCHLAFPKCSATGVTFACRSYCTKFIQLCSTLAAAMDSSRECRMLPESSCMEIPAQEVCRSDQFLCRNGPVVNHLTTCVAASRRCDNQTDCLDKSDELNCPKQTCSTDEFRCVNGMVVGSSPGRCVSLVRRCNGVRDCTDGSDEMGCERDCPANMFTCTNGFNPANKSRCIPHTKLCDDVPDCTDGSDERCTVKVNCRDDEFRCVTGVDKYHLTNCIIRAYRCDGNRDCIDGSDEEGCPPICQVGQFNCQTGGGVRFPFSRCLNISSRCDGRYDCQDKSDEQSCSQCPNGGFRCNNGTLKAPLIDRVCTNPDGRCNGVTECMDGSDEVGCPRVKCQIHQFTCKNGHSKTAGPGQRCISLKYRCDLVEDCTDGSDERACTYTCHRSEFKCVTGTVDKPPGRKFCIPNSQRCDGRVNCRDGSDERNCTRSCRPSEFSCDLTHGNYNRTCISLTEKCDRKRNCADGRDESPQTCDQTRCSDGQIRCARGFLVSSYFRRCYNASRRCDARMDCTDNSDESECGDNPPSCFGNRFKCTNGYSLRRGRRCISRRQVCDSVRDCSDGSDERGCTYTCRPGQFKCRNGTVTRRPYTGRCIGREEECDGHIDCADGSDELDCESKACSPGFIRCPSGNARDLHNGDLCIKSSWLCDGDVDCTDESDENLPQCQQKHGDCPRGYYRCNTTVSRYPYKGRCIRSSEVCDGHVDCQGGDDEPADCWTRPCHVTQSFRCGRKRDGTRAVDKHNGDYCIPTRWLCDGEIDCTNSVDEMYCGRG